MFHPDKVKEELGQAITELLQVAGLSRDNIVVVGCSTSEIAGHQIGTASSIEVADIVWTTLSEAIRGRQLYLAVQCCEHLNRSLVVEREAMDKFGLEEVAVVPAPKAGGALAAVAIDRFQDPVVVERIQAHAGVDIGNTLIGMHLKPVVVPVRPTVRQIGSAQLVMARTRPKLIGGERAVYQREETGKTGDGSAC